jgi:hypothetical protein
LSWPELDGATQHLSHRAGIALNNPAVILERLRALADELSKGRE